MSWWQQPFTLIYVPHDGSNARSLTVKRVTFVLLIFLGAFFTSTGLLVSLFGLQSPSNNSKAVNQRVEAEAKSTNNSRQSLHETIASLEKQLQTTKKQHQQILQVAGIRTSPTNPAEPSDIEDWSEEGGEVLEQTIERNERLKQIEKFVQSRNKVFRHTPTLWPTDGWLSSPYGYRQDPMGGKGQSFHDGVDIAAWHGNPVRATADGTVVFSGHKTGYGEVVKVEHEYGYTSLYGHLSERLVSEGEQITKGSALGRVGNTGHSTGSHVHYEVQVNDEHINPWPYLVEEFQTYRQYAMKGESE